MFSSQGSQVSNDANYIEDVCSVYLRTGTGSSQTVTTGIKENTGALVISKSRSAATDWAWYDTFRGATYDLVSNSTAAQTTQAQGLTSFNVDGHTWGTLAKVNTNGATYVDTVLKPTPKFFDVVTYTGNGGTLAINHALASTPGCVFVKRTNSTSDWVVGHRGSGSYWASSTLRLNTTAAGVTNGEFAAMSDTTVTVVNSGGSYGDVNANGATYVMYLFAHDAGGFGLTGTDNVISCGSVTTTSGVSTVTLGYEPQYLLMKQSDGVDSWWIIDTMRSWSQTGYSRLFANTSGVESAASGAYIVPTATGFTVDGSIFGSGRTYIYIAIRRGPMKVPTDATKVFSPIVATSTSGDQQTTNFPVDMQMLAVRAGLATNTVVQSRLTGVNTTATLNSQPYLSTSSTAAEATATNRTRYWNNTGYQLPNYYDGAASIYLNFRRAPNFFDEVCYTGTGTAGQTFSHNLGVAPELMIVKCRSTTGEWRSYSSALTATKWIVLNTTAAAVTGAAGWNNTEPTASVFSVGNSSTVNGSGVTYVAYLFATCAGVSKVGSYTGNGSTQTINCGFAGGARFVLIKRTDSTGDCYVYDTARGMTTLTDPYLLLNSTAAESATLGSVTTVTGGFAVNASILSAINTNSASYVFLAIA